MGFLFIFLSLMFLSADLPFGFLAACDQSRLLQRVAITIPGRKWTSLAEAVSQVEFALVNAHLVLFAVGRERTRAYSILVPTSG